MEKPGIRSIMTLLGIFSIAAAMTLAACKHGKDQNQAENAEDSVQEEVSACSPLSAEKAAALIADVNENTAADCGLELIYQEEIEGELLGEYCDFSTFTYVYGSGVERGDKLEYGYELKPVGDHACWFRYDLDTSRNGTFYFKNKEDAECFFQDLIDYGLVIMNDAYLLPTQKLPDGSVKVESLIDYDIIAQIIPPHPDEFSDYYIIEIGYYA